MDCHNSPSFQAACRGIPPFAGGLSPSLLPFSFLIFFVVQVRAAVSAKQVDALPLVPSAHAAWIFRALSNSTRGLARPDHASDAANHVLRILSTMRVGREVDHLQKLISLVDFRGSDVRLESGSICEGSRRAVPYPAIAWSWKTIQSYSWTAAQHINVLELIAFCNFY